MTKEQILKRIKHLLALSENNSEVAEATLAAQRAQELMLEWKISEAQLKADSDEEVVLDTQFLDRDRALCWTQLAVALCDSCDCGIWKKRRNKWTKDKGGLIIVGTEPSRMIVEYMYFRLRSLVKRMSLEYTREVHGRTKFKGSMKARLQFSEGAVAEIAHRLREEKKNSMDNIGHIEELSTALVVLKKERKAVDDYLAGMQFGKARSRNGHGYGMAYRTGQKVGKDLDINTKGIRGTAPKRRQLS